MEMSPVFAEQLISTTTIAEQDLRVLNAVQALKDHYGLKSDRQLLLKMGLNQALFYKIRSGVQKASLDLINTLIDHYQVNPNYIFKGDGTPLVSFVSVKEQANAALVSDEGYANLPLVTAKAAASFIETFLDDHEKLPTEMVKVPVSTLNGSATSQLLIVEIHGESMEPQLRHGAKVVGKYIPKHEWQYQHGGVYVVLYDKSLVVKRIKDNELLLNQRLMLHSDNPNSGSFPVPAESVREMWKVISLFSSPVY
jgi:hypothetical protein